MFIQALGHTYEDSHTSLNLFFSHFFIKFANS